MPENHVVTISRFLIEQERKIAETTTGTFTGLLSNIALAAKVISHQVNRAGLAEILGETGQENFHGERIQKLDLFADDVMQKALDHTGLITCMASEENEFFWPSRLHLSSLAFELVRVLLVVQVWKDGSPM